MELRITETLRGKPMETRETRKRKVAVFVNGWNAENVQRYLTGLSENTPAETIDYYVFVSYGIYSSTDVELKSLCAIYDLPDLKTFDAAIMFVPGLNFTDVINHLLEPALRPYHRRAWRPRDHVYSGITRERGFQQSPHCPEGLHVCAWTDVLRFECLLFELGSGTDLV